MLRLALLSLRREYVTLSITPCARTNHPHFCHLSSSFQTIVPPALTNFQVIVGLNANIAGTANLDAGIEASFSTGQIEIFTIGIPGLDFPGYVYSLTS